MSAGLRATRIELAPEPRYHRAMIRLAAVAMLLLAVTGCDPTPLLAIADQHFDAIETERRQACLDQPGPPSECWGD